MPTYEYVCDDCKHEFEQFQSIKADPLKTCPKCQQNRLRRLIGPGAALIFKGSGFYQTDYRSESYKKAAKAEKDASGVAKPSTDSASSGSGASSGAGDSNSSTTTAPKSDSSPKT